MVPACAAGAAHRQKAREAKIHPIERSLRMTTPLHTGAGCRRDGQTATVTLKPGVTTNTMLLACSPARLLGLAVQRGSAGAGVRVSDPLLIPRCYSATISPE